MQGTQSTHSRPSGGQCYHGIHCNSPRSEICNLSQNHPHPTLPHSLQALGKLELGAQFDDWFKHRMPILFWMAHTLLENKSSTHVLGVQVDYDPTKSLPFQVRLTGSCRSINSLGHM
jgi:hypothetical protein